MKFTLTDDTGTQHDLTDAVLSATQPREPGQETANRSTITTADRADVFHQNQDVQAKANQSLRDKLDNAYAAQIAELSKINTAEAAALSERRGRRVGNDGTYDKASDRLELNQSRRDYSDAEDDENRRQNTDAAMARQTNLSAFNQDDIVTIELARMLKSSDTSVCEAATLLLNKITG